MKIYTPLWIVFRDDKDSEIAKELLPRYESLIFKYWIAFMDDVCNMLNGLSKSVDCERAFSLQNIVKTKLRNRLTVKSTSDLMRCSRDGDSIKKFNWEHHLDAFLVSKNRRIQ